jgi:hypothetical protein
MDRPSNSFECTPSAVKSMGQMRQLVEAQFGVGFDSFRVFSKEGIEYQDEDLRYLKHGEVLYVT